MSRQLRMQACSDGQSAKPEESAIAAVGGEPDTATASAGFDDVSDVDLLAIYQEHARGSRERTAACEGLVSRCGLRADAAPCITGEIKRHFRDKQWQIRVTRPLQELLLEERGAIEDLTHELGRGPLESEVAGRLGVTPAKLREARRAGQGFSALSLSAPVGHDEDSVELGDLLGVEDTAVEHMVDMVAVERHRHELPRREQQILLLRFYGNQTQEQVADQYRSHGDARLGLAQ